MSIKRFSVTKIHYRFFGALSFLIICSFLLYFSPAEQTLGEYVKLVYFHAALVWATLLLFATALGFLLYGLVFNKEAFGNVGSNFFYTASAAWFLNGIISIVSMQVIWGAVAWQEPRFKSMLTVLFILLIGIAIAMFFQNNKIKMALLSSSIIFVFLSWITAADVIHPPNAISASSSPLIKLFTTGITMSLFFSGILIGRGGTK